MANNHDWALTVVGDLLDGFDADPEASVLGLLALGYGQSVPALLTTRWSDVDLLACVWRVGGEALELTAPFLVLLERYQRGVTGQGDRLFIGRKGRALGKTEANARVHELTREFFKLDDLLDLLPDMGVAEWAQCLCEYVDLGATAEQAQALEREFNRRRCRLLEAWHGDVLCIAAAMSARGFTR